MRARGTILLALWLGLGVGTSACSRTRGRDFLLPRDAGSACGACDDGLFCNGRETCDEATGRCVAGDPTPCDDDDECTIDTCDEARNRCTHVETPRDEDGDGFDACHEDCDDENADIHPGATELCDEVDQDCDGTADEGLRSECGDCRPGCRLIDVPEEVTGPWQPTASNSSAVVVEGGALVLTSEMNERFDAWIAHSTDGKVTKLDTRDGRQVARYDSVLVGDDHHAPPPDELCDRTGIEQQNGGNCPSRTAVDLQGAVYVANRAFGRQGTVTKIAGFPEDCVDRDGDGEITTSRDVNDNGRIDTQVEGEYVGQRDECILWTVDVGGTNGVPRAVAVAADGTVWVGLHGDSAVEQLDPSTGDRLARIATPGFRPYGMAVDGQGTLWVTEVASGQILSIDTRSGDVGKARLAPSPASGCPSNYGIAIDHADRVWISGFTCPYAFRYDPTNGDWMAVPLPDSGVLRGIAADDLGRVFVAASHAFLEFSRDAVFGYLETSAPFTRLTRFRADDGGDVRIFGSSSDPLPGGGAIGVGLDDAGRAWLVNQDTGSATRVDTDTGEVSHHEVGNYPYTYSDFTGFALRRITAPSGFIREVVEGCPMGPSEWERVTLDADRPAGATLQVRLRTAASESELADASWVGPWSSETVDLLAPPGPLPEARFLEVEARLVSGDRATTPTLREIVVQVHCPLWDWD